MRCDVSRHQTLRDVTYVIEQQIRQVDNGPIFGEVVLIDGLGGSMVPLDMTMTVETSGLFVRRRHLKLGFN